MRAFSIVVDSFNEPENIAHDEVEADFSEEEFARKDNNMESVSFKSEPESKQFGDIVLMMSRLGMFSEKAARAITMEYLNDTKLNQDTKSKMLNMNEREYRRSVGYGSHYIAGWRDCFLNYFAYGAKLGRTGILN